MNLCFLINKLPPNWRYPAQRLIYGALRIKPSLYLGNAFIVPFTGGMILAFIALNWKLLLAFLLVVSVCNLLMALIAGIHQWQNR